MEFRHYSVMLEECIAALNIKENGIYLDCTLGGCGHTRRILEALPSVRVIGLDRDDDAIANARNTLTDPRFTAVKANFASACGVLDSLGVQTVDGVLMDLGVSSYQLDNADRGFSYMKDAPLDMRMDRSGGITAYDVVNGYSEPELVRILTLYGEERFARRIASRICDARAAKPIESTLELARLASAAIPAKNRSEGHPARRTFQAVRIEVNGELAVLEESIRALTERLSAGGRFAVISFHSLEDRIVKSTFASLADPCVCPRDLPVCACGRKPSVRILTKKPILPSERENAENNRSHSAKLRVAEKL
ncbi:MAG TPA: 16S rRNA (cytosine(1402)-N(4))-methyltransferase RsmH [Firmicutes bacterium]|nr:16S rRNA (cytosine(1402)-N(4))-methyltransferase RsmH [Bacillota bacterium]